MKVYACAEDGECAHLKNTEKLYINSDEKDATTGYKYFDDRFGDTEQACIEGYFQYNHTYGCNAPTQMDVPGEGSVKACKFQIGVQAKDNWGWCNGDDGDKTKSGYSPELGTDTCDSVNYPDTAEKYDGAIYMIP